ncbi:hypothetical protein O9K51_11396 [Purpureocillium lavendulum]|uniref:Uncharacterized protein n=1 Tax=Purpureocillium lavendulum TaxID=1247861 RepID=A0AB34FAS2_9HYPO|nr:hypothetical protein O9K51_11396 [Purpureocillium lavendulum]
MAPTRESAQKPTAPAKAGVGANRQTRGSTAKAQEQLRKQLLNAEKQLEEADGAKRAELENQIRVSQARLNDVMDLDDSGTGGDEANASATAGVATDNAPDRTKANGGASTRDDVRGNVDGANASSANHANSNGSSQVQVIKQEEGLFVASPGGALGHTSGDGGNEQPEQPLASTEAFLEEDDSTIGLLTRALGDVSLGRGFGDLEMFYKGPFGLLYGLYRYGHNDGPRYSIHCIGKGKPTDISMSFESKSALSGTAKQNCPMFQIRGVAWKDAKDCGRMDSLSEDNWASAIRQMFVKIRWGSKNGPDTWERLRAFKTFAYPRAGKVATEKPYVYKNITLLRKGAKRHPGELLALENAIKWELWSRDVEYNGGRRTGRSSPGAVSQPEANEANGNAQAPEEEEQL